MVTSEKPFDAVLLISFGGPQGVADIRPFLENVLHGRRIPPARIEEVAHHYEMFDGVSPLTEITLRQAAGLETRLREAGSALPVYVGMRNWHPYLAETIGEMTAAGHRRAIGFILAAHRSYSSCGQYKQDVIDARRAVVEAGGQDLDVRYVDDWHAHEKFIAAEAERVEAAYEEMQRSVRESARLVFTAHSLPVSMADRCTYVQQLRESAGLVAQKVGQKDWALVYQSRSGRPTDPWLRPDICDYLRTENEKGLRAAVIVPIGFVCDHIEVLYDLDHEAAGVCKELGIAMVRASSVNDHPLFVEMMADVVRSAIAAHKACVPLPIVAAEM